MVPVAAPILPRILRRGDFRQPPPPVLRQLVVHLLLRVICVDQAVRALVRLLLRPLLFTLPAQLSLHNVASTHIDTRTRVRRICLPTPRCLCVSLEPAGRAECRPARPLQRLVVERDPTLCVRGLAHHPPEANLNHAVLAAVWHCPSAHIYRPGRVRGR